MVSLFFFSFPFFSTLSLSLFSSYSATLRASAYLFFFFFCFRRVSPSGKGLRKRKEKAKERKEGGRKEKIKKASCASCRAKEEQGPQGPVCRSSILAVFQSGLLCLLPPFIADRLLACCSLAPLEWSSPVLSHLHHPSPMSPVLPSIPHTHLHVYLLAQTMAACRRPVPSCPSPSTEKTPRGWREKVKKRGSGWRVLACRLGNSSFAS